jgi:hypothetical protein
MYPKPWLHTAYYLYKFARVPEIDLEKYLSQMGMNLGIASKITQYMNRLLEKGM